MSLDLGCYGQRLGCKHCWAKRIGNLLGNLNEIETSKHEPTTGQVMHPSGKCLVSVVVENHTGMNLGASSQFTRFEDPLCC